jgi:hypothetical protein
MKIDPPIQGFEEVVVALFDDLQQKCYLNSKDKGFWQEQDEVLGLIRSQSYNPEVEEKMVKAVNNAFHAMKGDLMHSELGERTEAQRKDLPSDKLPAPFTGEEEELADTVIRILDYAGRRRMKLGLAIALKMRYNAGRPFMHGKKF